MTIPLRLFDGPIGRCMAEMAFWGSVSKRGGQEVVDHDKGQRLTKGKPRTSYKDPWDKRPMAPLLHLWRIFLFPYLFTSRFLSPFLSSTPLASIDHPPPIVLSLSLVLRQDICKGTLSIEFSWRIRATEVTQSESGYGASLTLYTFYLLSWGVDVSKGASAVTPWWMYANDCLIVRSWAGFPFSLMLVPELWWVG